MEGVYDFYPALQILVDVLGSKDGSLKGERRRKGDP